MRPPKTRRIVIAVYEGVSLLDLAGPLEAFRVASGFFGSRESRVTYECSVVSIRGGSVKTANGVELVTESVRSLGRDPIDTLIVPGAFAVDDVTRDRAPGPMGPRQISLVSTGVLRVYWQLPSGRRRRSRRAASGYALAARAVVGGAPSQGDGRARCDLHP